VQTSVPHPIVFADPIALGVQPILSALLAALLLGVSALVVVMLVQQLFVFEVFAGAVVSRASTVW
jgi:hypothetical protein